MRFLKRAALGATFALMAATALHTFAGAAENIGDIEHPLWYQPPSQKTLELAKIDDLSQTVVSDGQRGETGVLGSTIEITD